MAVTESICDCTSHFRQFANPKSLEIPSTGKPYSKLCMQNQLRAAYTPSIHLYAPAPWGRNPAAGISAQPNAF